MAFNKYPRFIEFIEELPKTFVGKVLHRELKEIEEEKKKLLFIIECICNFFFLTEF